MPKTKPRRKIIPFPDARRAMPPYACRPTPGVGRAVVEPAPSNRSEFQRDRDRIIHCAAFRKLEYKTQVFVNHEGDYYRTRLTHSLEVAQIARSIARSLGLNEDLSEAVALAHDLGHTPFGHAGEEALNDAMKPYGGFDHNDQALRVLTQLEQRYAEFDGLNLTWDTLEGVVKHNGPLAKNKIPPAIAQYNKIQNLQLNTWPSAEAQVAALSDDIAYCNHDIDDGLRAGLFTLDDLAEVGFVGSIIQQTRRIYPNIETDRLIPEMIRNLIGKMVDDVLAETGRRLEDLKPQHVDDIRSAGRAMVAFSPAMQKNLQQLKSFLMERMYRHYRVNRMTSKARRVIGELFAFFMEEKDCLPADWQRRLKSNGKPQQARVIADYIAGMTDRYALDEHRRLYDLHARG